MRDVRKRCINAFGYTVEKIFQDPSVHNKGDFESKFCCSFLMHLHQMCAEGECPIIESEENSKEIEKTLQEAASNLWDKNQKAKKLGKKLDSNKVLFAIKYIADNICSLLKKVLGKERFEDYKTYKEIKAGGFASRNIFSKLMEVSEVVNAELQAKTENSKVKSYYELCDKQIRSKGFGQFAKYVGDHHPADSAKPAKVFHKPQSSSREK